MATFGEAMLCSERKINVRKFFYALQYELVICDGLCVMDRSGSESARFNAGKFSHVNVVPVRLHAPTQLGTDDDDVKRQFAAMPK